MAPIPHVPTFLDIATFFGICVWLVSPFEVVINSISLYLLGTTVSIP